MLYESKIRVTCSFRKLLHSLNERSYTFFMRQIEFHLDIQRKCIFAPINGQQYMCSLTRAFASHLTII